MERRRHLADPTVLDRREHKPPPPRPKALNRQELLLNVPSEDEFAAWCEHTVTRFVASAWAGMADKLKDQAQAALWATGVVDQRALDEARGEAKAYLSLLHATRSDYAFINQNPS